MNDKGQEILNTYNQLVTERTPLEQFWQDAFDYTYPIRGEQFSSNNTDPYARASSAKSKQAKIYDSTGTDSVRLLASGLLSGLTPSHLQWFTFDTPSVPDSLVPRDAKLWLQQAAETLFTAIHSSNYNSEAFELFIDLTVGGLCGLFVDFTEQFRFEQWALPTLYCQNVLGGQGIDTIYRSVTYKVREAVEKFGIGKVPELVKQQYERDPYANEVYQFIHTIRPRLNNGKQAKGKLKTSMPWESIYVCAKTGEIVQESGFHEMPVIVPRWFGIPGTDYALGPLNDALPDVKTLNRIVEMVLTNSEMAIAGTFVAKDDGVFNPNTVKIGPRRVIMVSDTENIKPLASGGNFNIAQSEIARLQAQIKRVMMSDQLAQTEKGMMTATEIQARQQIIRQVLGPALARLQSEFLEPLLKRCFGLAMRAGVLGQPPTSLGDIPFSPAYHSPIAKAQRFETIQAMNQLEEAIGGLSKLNPGILDLYDFDGSVKKRSDLFGVPAELLKDERQVAATRKAAAQQAQAQQALQQAPQLAAAAKNLNGAGEVGQNALAQIANG